MHQRRTIGLTLVSIALILAILACGSGTPASKATPVPMEPSATVAVEEPTAPKKATAAPTKASGGGGTTPACANVPDGEVGVAYDRSYIDRGDSLRVVGLVCNNTRKPVDNIHLAIDVFDANNTLLFTQENVSTNLDTLDAGEASPFGTGIYHDVPTADTYKVKIVSQDETTVERAKGVESQGVRMVVDDEGTVQLTGELINTGTEPVIIHNVAAATLDKDGQMESTDLPSLAIAYLDPGQSGPFRFSMIVPKAGAAPAGYLLFVDAETTSPKDFLINTQTDLTDISEFFDANGGYHIAGELTNSSRGLVSVFLLATLFDKDGNVLDTASTATAIWAIEPGETFPYEFNSWGPVESKKGVYAAADKWRIQVDPTLTLSLDTKLADLSKSVKDEKVSFDNYEGKFTGTVVNDSGGDLSSIKVIVGIRGKKGEPDEGKLLTMYYSNADITDKLAKGKSTTYTVYVPIPIDFDKTKYEYDVIAKGEAP